MLIPEETLVRILTDTYLTSGMMDIREMRETWGQRDSLQNYIDVIKSYGYTNEQLETTMKYYFSNKPKKLAKVYDRVTGNLLELETKVQSEKVQQDSIAGENLWKGKATYSFPEDFAIDPVWFDIPADAPGEYILRADIQVFNDDRSLDPRVTVYFSTTDSLGVEVRDDWREVRFEKNGQVQKIEISKTLEVAGMTHIKGWLMNHTNQEVKWQKHARISNISIRLNKPGLMQK